MTTETIILAADITTRTTFETNGIINNAHLAKVRDKNEWHVYLNNVRKIITEEEYSSCLDNELALQKFAIQIFRK